MQSLSDLALLLSPAAVYGEVDPRSYLIADDIDWTPISTSDFFRALDSSLAAVASAHDTIAVACSGGVDSAYCLHQLYQLKPPRHLVPIYFDARADRTAQYRSTALESIQTIAPHCRTVVLDTPLHGYWLPSGPSLHSVPAAAAAIEVAAAQAGATALVTGCGADEILTTPKYFGGSLLRRGSLGKFAGRFLNCATAGVGAIVEEFVSPMLFSALHSPAERRFRFVFEELHVTPPYNLLAPDYRSRSLAWTEALQGTLRSACCSQTNTLAQMDAYLSVFPLSRLGRVTDFAIDVRHPFQDPEVVRAGLRVPFGEKCGSIRRRPYARRKALLFDRLPAQFERVAPRSKVGYSSYTEQQSRYTTSSHESLQSIGFLDPSARYDRLDLSVRLMLGSIAEWISGARARGQSVTTH